MVARRSLKLLLAALALACVVATLLWGMNDHAVNGEVRRLRWLLMTPLLLLMPTRLDWLSAALLSSGWIVGVFGATAALAGTLAALPGILAGLLALACAAAVWGVPRGVT